MRKSNLTNITNGQTATENYIDFKKKQREALAQKQEEKECEAYNSEQLKKLEKAIVKSIEKSFKI